MGVARDGRVRDVSPENLLTGHKKLDFKGLSNGENLRVDDRQPV